MHTTVQMYDNDPVVVSVRGSVDQADHVIVEIRQQMISDSVTLILPTAAWRQIVERLNPLILVTQEG